MEFKTHRVNGVPIAELIGDEVAIHTESDGTDLIGNVYYQGFDRVVVHQRQLAPAFFDQDAVSGRDSPEIFELPRKAGDCWGFYAIG